MVAETAKAYGLGSLSLTLLGYLPPRTGYTNSLNVDCASPTLESANPSDSLSFLGDRLLPCSNYRLISGGTVDDWKPLIFISTLFNRGNR